MAWYHGHFLWCTYLFFNGLILWTFSLMDLPIFQWLESMDNFFDMLNTLIIFSLVLLWHLYLIYLTFLMHLSFSETLAWYYLNILFDMLNFFLAHLSFSEILAWCYLNILFDVLSFFYQWALMGLMLLGCLSLIYLKFSINLILFYCVFILVIWHTCDIVVLLELNMLIGCLVYVHLLILS